MAKYIQQNLIKTKSLLVLLKLASLSGRFHPIALIIGVLLLSSVVATPGQMGISVAQQPAATSQDATRAAAQRAYQEGEQLRKQGTAESLRQALTNYEEAVSLYRAVSNKKQEVLTLNNIGAVYSALGEKQKALNYYNQSLLLSREVGGKREEAVILNNIGAVYNALGEKQKALNYYNQSLPLSRAVGDRRQEARTLNNIGLVYDALGEKQKALDYYNQSLPVSRTLSDRAVEAVTLSNIGAVYGALGEKQKALDYYNQSLPLSRAVGDKKQEARTLGNIGRVYSDLEEKQKALDYYNQSLPLSQVVGDRTAEATTLGNIGGVYRELGEKQKALYYFNQSLPLKRAVGDRAGETVSLNNIGAVYEALGEKQKALDYYNQSLPLSRAVGDRAGEATILGNIALFERKRDNLNAALTQIEAVINIIESLRTKIASPELRASYFATVQDYYKFKIDLLMQLHLTNPSQDYNALALQTSDRSRARSLLELLTEAHADIRQGVDPKLLQQERTLQQQLDALEKRRIQVLSSNHTPEQAQAIETESSILLAKYQDVRTQIRQNSPRYAALTQPKPLTLAEIQQQVLDDDTILLQYSLGEERSYLWAVTKTGISSYELPKRADIEDAAKEFAQLLQSPGYDLADTRSLIRVVSGRGNVQTVANLGKMLLPDSLQLGNKRLLIVSDGTLQYIPFAALPTPGTSGTNVVPLLMQHEIVNSPSASTIAILRNELTGRKPASKTVAVLADPIFSSDDERVKSLAGAYGRTPLQQSVNGRAMPDDVDSLALARTARESGVTFKRLPFTRTEGDSASAAASRSHFIPIPSYPTPTSL